MLSGATILESFAAALLFPIVCHYNKPNPHVALAQIQPYAYTLARSHVYLLFGSVIAAGQLKELSVRYVIVHEDMPLSTVDMIQCGESK